MNAWMHKGRRRPKSAAMTCGLAILVWPGCSMNTELAKRDSKEHTSASVAKPSPNPDEVPEAKSPEILPMTHLSAARLHESNGHLPRAAEQYQQVIAMNPNELEAHNRLGIVLDRLGRFKEADDVFNKAIKRFPREASLRNNLAFSYIMQSRWRDAETELNEALSIRPDFARARVNLGMVLAQQEKYEQALDQFKAALPREDAYYNIGLMYQSQRRPEDAARAFQKALQQNPKMVAAQKRLDMLPPEVVKAVKESAAATASPPANAPAVPSTAPPASAEKITRVVDGPRLDEKTNGAATRPAPSRVVDAVDGNDPRIESEKPQTAKVSAAAPKPPPAPVKEPPPTVKEAPRAAIEGSSTTQSPPAAKTSPVVGKESAPVIKGAPAPAKESPRPAKETPPVVNAVDGNESPLTLKQFHRTRKKSQTDETETARAKPVTTAPEAATVLPATPAKAMPATPAKPVIATPTKAMPATTAKTSAATPGKRVVDDPTVAATPAKSVDGTPAKTSAAMPAKPLAAKPAATQPAADDICGPPLSAWRERSGPLMFSVEPVHTSFLSPAAPELIAPGSHHQQNFGWSIRPDIKRSILNLWESMAKPLHRMFGPPAYDAECLPDTMGSPYPPFGPPAPEYGFSSMDDAPYFLTK